MAVETEAMGSSRSLELDEEVEGDQIGTKNYRFVRIGEPVPISKSDSSGNDDDVDDNDGGSSVFDPQNLPSQPLAISLRFRLLFVALSHGFCVARTKDVISSAEAIKEKGTGSSIRELSIVDAPLGKVSILTLSPDDSTLAAVVGSHIHFFFVSALLHKERRPSFSLSINDSSGIRNMLWARGLEKTYVVLSCTGKLYFGIGQGSLNVVMDNVDAVEWSAKGNLVAVAKNNVLSILSSKFNERLSMTLPFNSFISDSDSNSTIKVDSIRWVREDCIILGCCQVADNGEIENYFVQVITSKEGKISDVSSKPIVQSFNDAFLGFNADIGPAVAGPLMFLNYHDQCELAFIGNRKNSDQHIVLLGWFANNGQNEAVMVDILNDAWVARIDPQGNDDDNFLLGLCLDKVSMNEKAIFKLGDEEKEVPPCCILLCLSVDARLTLFHFVSATGSFDQPKAVSAFSEVEEDTSIVHSESLLSKSPTGVDEGFMEKDVSILESHKSNTSEHFTEVDELKNNQQKTALQKSSSNSPLVSRSFVEASALERLEEKPVVQTLKGDEQQKIIVSEVKLEKSVQQPYLSGLQATNMELSSSASCLNVPIPVVRNTGNIEPQTCEVKSSVGSLSGRPFTDLSNPLMQKIVQSSHEKELPERLGSVSSWSGSSQSLSFGKLSSAKTSDGGSASLPVGHHTKTPYASEVSGGLPQGNSYLKEISAPLTSVSFSKQTTSTRDGSHKTLSTFQTSPFTLQENVALEKPFSYKLHPSKENYKSPSTAEPNLSKQFHNVEEMVKELDTLLDCIVREGGFKDACTTFLRSSVTAVEESMWSVSDRCRELNVITDDLLKEIQFLIGKRVQVMARKSDVEGIVKQATNDQYWDLWDRQKLSPELDLKKRHILDMNQVLTNQLIELERHFNALELSNFGKKGGVQMNRRLSHSKIGSSRQFKSLHSLHSTMNAQFAVAEQLSECLSKQMSALSIDSSSVRNQKVKKELFETIGIPYDGVCFSSPTVGKAGISPPDKNLLSLCSAATEQFKKKQSSMSYSSEPETVRRRRESLDQNWASFEPSKTTVKRILLQQERQKGNVRRPSLPMEEQHYDTIMHKESAAFQPSHFTTSSAFPSKDEGILGMSTRRLSSSTFRTSSSLFQWDTADLSQDVPVDYPAKQKIQANSTGFLSKIVPELGGTGCEKNGRKACDFTAGQSSSITSIEKTYSTLVNKPQPFRLSESHLTPKPSSIRPLSQAPTPVKSSSENSNAKDNEVVHTNSTFGNIKQKPAITNSLARESERTLLSSFGSAPSFSGNVIHYEAGKSKSQPGETSSSVPSSVLRSSVITINPSSALPLSSPSPSTATLSSGLFLGGSASISEVPNNADQVVSLSPSIASSSSSNFSFGSLQTDKKPVALSFIAPNLNLTSVSSDETKPVLVKSNVKTDEKSMTPALITKDTQNADNSSQEDVSQPEPPDTSALAIQLVVLPEQTSESRPPSSSKPENPYSFGISKGPASNGLHFNKDLTVAPEVTLSTERPSSISAEKTEGLDVANNQEDEMDEEVPEMGPTTEFALGNLGGFGIGSAPHPDTSKPNPFGLQFSNTAANLSSSSFTMTVPSGELFRPASFNFQSSPALQQSQSSNFNAFSMGTISPNTSRSGFGQPAQIGVGQQALGSVLGSFGQSRQIGAGLPGSGIASAGGLNSRFGSSGGFANASSGVGFASLASAGGGFAAAAGGGAFAAAASGGSGGGFAAAAGGGGGFAAAASVGSGFTGGFGAFNQQGSGNFSRFNNATQKQPDGSDLFTQMRK